jgi:hypothetical protein
MTRNNDGPDYGLDYDDGSGTIEARLAAGLKAARERRKEVIMESSDEEEFEDAVDVIAKRTATPSDNYCDQPTWSQEKEQRRKQCLTPKTVDATKAKIPTTNGTAATEETSPDSSAEGEENWMTFIRSLPFKPTTSVAENLRLYQDYMNSAVAKTPMVATPLAKLQAVGKTFHGENDLRQIVQRAEIAQAGVKKRARKLSAQQEAKMAEKEAVKRAKLKKREEAKKMQEEEKAAKEAEMARLVTVRKEIEKLVDNFQSEYFRCIKVVQEKNPKQRWRGLLLYERR